MSTISELPKTERPRERIATHGAEVLSDSELLAIFLRTGRVGRNVIEIAKDLLGEWGSLRRLAGCSVEELSQISGIGFAKATELKAAFEMGKRLLRPEIETPCMDDPHEVYLLMKPLLQSLAYESLWVLVLDARFRLIQQQEISRGTLSQSIGHPREIFKPAILKRAYAIVVVHNHPSGDPEPSNADRRLTKRIVEAGELLQIPVIDHVIIGTEAAGRDPYFSFRQAGLMREFK